MSSTIRIEARGWACRDERAARRGSVRGLEYGRDVAVGAVHALADGRRGGAWLCWRPTTSSPRSEQAGWRKDLMQCSCLGGKSKPFVGAYFCFGIGVR
jgi:hypothetical protein